jgi:hypothetical protein
MKDYEESQKPVSFNVTKDPSALLIALMEANEICRSMHAIAERIPNQGAVALYANWPAFKTQLNRALENQHKVLWPEAKHWPCEHIIRTEAVPMTGAS